MTMRCAFDSFLFRGTRFSRPKAHYSLHRHQLSHSHQVVSRRREDEDPVHARRAALAQLAQQPDRLQPTEDFFDPFAFLLTDLIAGMARRASITDLRLVLFWATCGGTFCAIDSASKIVPSYKVGKRDHFTANTFMDDLASRLKNRIQLASDDFAPYLKRLNKRGEVKLITARL